MACGCGGECCGQPKGLGFLSYGENAGGWWDDLSQGEYDWLMQNYGGWDSPGGWWDTSGGGYGLDFWGLDDASYWNYYGYQLGQEFSPGANPGFNVDFGFQPSGGGSDNSAWQSLLDWWAELTRGNTQPNNPPLLGYCPGGTYHPTNDPYSCVPFPAETPEFERQQRAAAAHKAAQDALKAAAARAQQQQAQQPCPPNTGLVKNALGKCVCPPPLQFSQSAGKCVLASQLTEADKAALASQQWDWLKILGIGAIVIVGVRALR